MLGIGIDEQCLAVGLHRERHGQIDGNKRLSLGRPGAGDHDGPAAPLGRPPVLRPEGDQISFDQAKFFDHARALLGG